YLREIRCLRSPDDHGLRPHTAHARLLPPRPRAPSMRLCHFGSRESRHSLITNDFTSPSRMNGSSLEKASASSRVLKMAMLPPSVNGRMPRTTPGDESAHARLVARIHRHDRVPVGARKLPR